MSRIEIEALVTTVFSHCPFCSAKDSMKFEWGHSIPKSMSCSGCEAKWELLFSLNEHWSFVGAKLSATGSTEKGTDLKGKMHDKKFWEKKVLERVPHKPILNKEEFPTTPEKIVIIREIVKIRCPYCGSLYNEPEDKCPNCGGRR